MNTLEFRKLPQLSYPVNEAFNTLSTNISFLGRDTKKLMLTSSHASEGKSFTSLSLARKLAERGKRVVLVDTDLRRSMIVSTYGVKFPQDSKKYGLSHYLAGIAEQDEVLYKTNVFMGMGEPLLNLKNVMRALESLNNDKGLNFSPRRITVSTCGIEPVPSAAGSSGRGI